MTTTQITSYEITKLNERLATIDPITVDVGAVSYNITGVALALWEKNGRRIYLNPKFSWDDSRYQIGAPYIDLETGTAYYGTNGGFVNSGRKSEAARAAQLELIRVVKTAMEAL